MRAGKLNIKNIILSLSKFQNFRPKTSKKTTIAGFAGASLGTPGPGFE